MESTLAKLQELLNEYNFRRRHDSRDWEIDFLISTMNQIEEIVYDTKTSEPSIEEGDDPDRD
jgi:hypothetical protein